MSPRKRSGVTKVCLRHPTDRAARPRHQRGPETSPTRRATSHRGRHGTRFPPTGHEHQRPATRGTMTSRASRSGPPVRTTPPRSTNTYLRAQRSTGMPIASGWVFSSTGDHALFGQRAGLPHFVGTRASLRGSAGASGSVQVNWVVRVSVRWLVIGGDAGIGLKRTPPARVVR